MGCGCGDSTPIPPDLSMVDALAALRATIVTMLDALGAADPCPTTRRFDVYPSSGAIEAFGAVDHGGVLGALDAALARMGELGGASRLRHSCL